MPNLAHLSAPAGAHDVPEVAMDCCFLAKDTSDTSLTVLVIKDRNSKRSWHTRCCARGACTMTPWIRPSLAFAG
eukprot:1658485-Alexandrium_andersonii.AAC.1